MGCLISKSGSRRLFGASPVDYMVLELTLCQGYVDASSLCRSACVAKRWHQCAYSPLCIRDHLVLSSRTLKRSVRSDGLTSLISQGRLNLCGRHTLSALWLDLSSSLISENLLFIPQFTALRVVCIAAVFNQILFSTFRSSEVHWRSESLEIYRMYYGHRACTTFFKTRRCMEQVSASDWNFLFGNGPRPYYLREHRVRIRNWLRNGSYLSENYYEQYGENGLRCRVFDSKCSPFIGGYCLTIDFSGKVLGF